ncbi:MAG: hypothetical protein AAFU61_07815 [Pseudomonadota bacterium]
MSRWRAPAEQGPTFGDGTLQRVFRRHGITREPRLRMPPSRRHAWFDGPPDLDPDRLIFTGRRLGQDEHGRTHGRCRRGERLRMGVPHGH